jgi:hypothetical protein
LNEHSKQVVRKASHAAAGHQMEALLETLTAAHSQPLAETQYNAQYYLDHHVSLEVVLKTLELKLKDWWEVIKQNSFACVL